MKMQHVHNEQKSNMDDMIRQVALLIEMVKEIQENRARSGVNVSREEEEGVSEASKKEPSSAENESEVPPEKQKEIKAVEMESAEEETLVEEESITTPPDDEALQKILEEVNDEPQEKEEEVIERGAVVDNTLFYLNSKKVHVPGEKVGEFTITVDGENPPIERPPPVIDKSEECYYEEEEPELKKERPRRRVARFIYWVQLQPWPESLRAEKPPDLGLRPKENKKTQGTYKNHKKMRGAMMVVCPQKKNQWIEERRVKSGSPIDDRSHKSLPTFELIKLGSNSKPLDQVNCKGGDGNKG